MRRWAERFIAPFFVLCLLLSCSDAGQLPAPTTSPTQPPATAPTPTSSASSFWAEAAAPYRDIVLRGISENSPPSLYVRNVLAPAFQRETGIQVQLDISTNPTIEKIISGELSTNKEAGNSASQNFVSYDFVYVEQDVIYGYLAQQRLSNLSQLLTDQRSLNAPDFKPNNFTSFIKEFSDPASGALYGVPIEAFIKVYLYRTDLFDDPAIQTAFAQSYHYPLAPAITFAQYRDIAEFFTTYGRTHHLPLWGTTVQATSDDIASFYEFFETIAPSFGIYNWGINLQTYSASTAKGGQLDSEQTINALTYWIDLLPFAPPEANQSDWADVAATFAAGRAAQGWIYGEYVAELATNPIFSQVVGKVGVALPPTAPGVMEDATIGTGYLGYYDGAAFGIPIDSQHKEAALLWLQYLGQPTVQPHWATESGRVVHLSTFDDPLVQAQDQRLHGYYTLMKKHGNLFAGAPPFPFHVAVRDTITPYIQRAIRHELTPRQALQQAAHDVDTLLLRLGYSK